MGINKSYGNKITLGSSWIIGHDVIFDKQNKLIGFAEANCYQNNLINKTNGLELKDDVIQRLESELKVGNIKDYNDNKVNKINDNSKYLEIIIIFFSIILVILIIIVILMTIKYLKQKNIVNSEIISSNNRINYINVPTDNY